MEITSRSDTASDLLTRHERLSHSNRNSDVRNSTGDGQAQDGQRANKRRRTGSGEGMQMTDHDHYAAPMAPSMGYGNSSGMMDSMATPHTTIEADHPYSLATLSMAAEQAALQDAYIPPTVQVTEQPMSMHMTHQDVQIGRNPDPLGNHYPGLDFEESLDSLANFIDNNPLSSYQFGSVISAEQPMPFFSPAESLPMHSDPSTHVGNLNLPHFSQLQSHMDEPGSFSRFGSRLPSLQPEDQAQGNQGAAHSFQRTPRARGFTDIGVKDREAIVQKVSPYLAILSPQFQLPSRLALSRYLAAYVNGFHEHLPFLHIPTMTAETCSIELILAMAAVGAQYCFEGDKGVDLFNAAHAIAAHRIRRRDAKLAGYKQENMSPGAASNQDSRQTPADNESFTSQMSPYQNRSGHLGLPYEYNVDLATMDREDLVQTAQALLLLMAMATWAKHKEILREALAIQSVLATIVRDDGLKGFPLSSDVSWEDWVRYETTKRTKFIVYSFFNLHCIVYNIPPLILSSEMRLNLPSTAAEFRAESDLKWHEVRQRAPPEKSFQEVLNRLFTRQGKESTETNTSLGNYVLIHALIQHIFFIRQSARYRLNGNTDLMPDDVQTLEQALRNWQLGWSRNPESSLDPMDPNGPVAFNSTALLRLAYIRLNVDIGPGRALDTRDPIQIANAFRESPALRRSPKLVRAVLHSAHALSIPVKIGIRLVAATQTFIWSIQHSLCSLECAFLLSKWLEALSHPNTDPPVSEDEQRIGRIVRTMLDETEFDLPPHIEMGSAASYKHLSAGVLRVWATIFRGAQTWAIVDVIGTGLHIYADMLEAG